MSGHRSGSTLAARRAAIGAIAGILVLAACAPAASTPSGSPGASLVVAATATAPAPSATAGAAGAAFPVGPIPAGTWTATLFSPVFQLTMPAGWLRGPADREVLVLRKGDSFILFSHTISSATAASLGTGATETSVAGLVAYVRTQDGETHLGYTDGQQELVSPVGSRVRQWVFEAGGRAVTVALVAPAAVFDAAVAEFEPILGTFTVVGG